MVQIVNYNLKYEKKLCVTDIKNAWHLYTGYIVADQKPK
jgi:hypothetical protein